MKLAGSEEVKKIYGKATLGSSYSKAARYLIESLLDERSFVSRGQFEQCVIRLSDLCEKLSSEGNTLNQMLRSHATGQATDTNFEKTLFNLKSLVESNLEILDTFTKSISLKSQED